MEITNARRREDTIARRRGDTIARRWEYRMLFEEVLVVEGKIPSDSDEARRIAWAAVDIYFGEE